MLSIWSVLFYDDIHHTIRMRTCMICIIRTHAQSVVRPYDQGRGERFRIGGGGGVEVSYDNDQRFRLWVVQIYFLIGVKVNRQVQLTRKVYLSRKYTHYIHFNYNFLTLFYISYELF